jgi:hypothetical protein
VIDPKDLAPKTLENFQENGVKLGIQALRYSHYEAKRKLKLKAIENLIRKAQRKHTSAGRQISQLLQDVEALNT